MSFDAKGFTPVHVNAGAVAPRIFSYCNVKDTLDEILEPGYFNKQRILLRPNSFVKVVCKNAIAELVIEKNTGPVTFREEMTFFETEEERAGTKPRRKPRKKPKKALSKTG